MQDDPHTRTARRHLAAALLALAVLALGVWLWLSRTQNDVLRDQLRRWQFWGLEAQFVFAAVLTARHARAVAARLAASRQMVMAVAAASALALVLTSLVAPRTNRIYYDEQIYQSVAQNLSDLRLAQMCNEGTVEYGRLQCTRAEYNKQPYGYPYLLSVGYRVAGVRDSVAFVVNNLSVAALVWVVFVTVALLFENARAGALAGLIIALIPMQLTWSNTAAPEPMASLACAMALMTGVAFVRLRTTGTLVWMVATAVFAAQFRPECLLVGLVLASLLVTHAPGELRRGRFWWAAALGLCLGGLLLGHLFAVRNEGWGTSGSRLSFQYVLNNLRSNGWFYLWDERFPALVTVLAIVGIVAERRRRAVFVAVAYFFAFWGLFLFFYAGSYNYGADVRYSLMTYPPLAILAGLGADRLVVALGRWAQPPRLAVACVVAALLGQFTWYLPIVRAVGEESWGARNDVRFAREVAASLPSNAIVLTHNPNMFQVWGVNAAQVSIATADERYARTVMFQRFSGGVYFYWNFWCNVADPVQVAFCQGVLDRFGHELVREQRDRDYRYALYRLRPDPETRDDPPR